MIYVLNLRPDVAVKAAILRVYGPVAADRVLILNAEWVVFDLSGLGESLNKQRKD